MKRKIGVIATFLAFAAAPIVLAQLQGAERIHLQSVVLDRNAPETATTRQLLPIGATDIQREAFSHCLTTTERTDKLAFRIARETSHWHGSIRVYNLRGVYGKRDQLQSALTDMASAHQQFLQVLSQDQDAALGANLNTLEHLQSDLNIQMSQLNEDLMAARLDPIRISTDLYGIERTIDKWVCDYKRIAKEMGITKA